MAEILSQGVEGGGVRFVSGRGILMAQNGRERRMGGVLRSLRTAAVYGAAEVFAMVRIITVEREYGSMGAEFAHRLADRLGWRLIDRCVVEEIARKAGVESAMVANCDERLDPWYYRLGKTFWHGSVERMPAPMDTSTVFDSERMAGMVRDYLKDRVAEGHCVVVGRGAAAALTGVPGAFHVFVYASHGRKVAWFREHFPDRAGQAEEELEATDRRRRAYVRRFYNQEWDDRRLYQLMINSCMGFEAMIRATLEATALAAHVPERVG
jgi:cytidylate kinase